MNNRLELPTTMNTTQPKKYLSMFTTNISRLFLSCLLLISSFGVIAQTTRYSYQNGNWETASTWTTDPSGTLSLNPAVPLAGDNVVILNGRTVTVTGVGKTVASVDIQDGAILNLGATNGHAFTNLSGQGILKLSSTTLPAGTMTNFVASTGGTIEYFGSTSFAFNRSVFNNLIINLNATGTTATINTGFTVNGNLHIKRGTLIIGDGTSRNVYVEGNTTVDASGRINVGAFVQRHNLYLRGDFTVNGAVTFTNRTVADYLTDGGHRVHVIFDNATKDQQLSINASALFYRIGINKGTDDTYILHVEASDADFFKLYGPNNRQENSPGAPPSILNENALGLEAGTLRLGANIIIPALASSVNYNYTSFVNPRNFVIDEDATLWIDGATVYTTHYKAPSNNIKSIMSIYGKLRITSGTLIDEAAQGIGLRKTGQLIVEGGVLESTIIRTSAESGTHRGAYIQTGGTVTIRRDISTFDGFSGSFHLGFSSTSFRMSGGELNILASTPTTSIVLAGTPVGRQFSFVLTSSPENIDVTGGTINITVPTDREARFTGKGQFNNINFLSSSSAQQAIISTFDGSANNEAVSALPLVAKKDLTITGQARFNPNNLNVTVGGDFKIETSATYTPGTNTTIFNGSSGQFFDNAGTITSGLNNMTVSNSSILSISNNLSLRSNLSIGSGVLFRDMGKTISVQGNITNDGAHESQTSSAAIVLTGTGNQIIGGNGSGVFGNLWLNKSAGSTTLAANTSINKDLRLANTNAVFNIGSYQLTLSSSSNVYDDLIGEGTTFSSTRMIETSGLQTDAGLRINFASTNQRLFPVGVSGKYTRATVAFELAPTLWGSVSIRPVNGMHPLRTGNNILGSYWRVSSEGFTEIPANSLKLRFYYLDGDVNGTVGNYVPAVFVPISWSTFSTDDVTLATREILFDQIALPDGDYTAGEPTSLESIIALYSRQSGSWTETSTWTTNPDTNEEATITPTANTTVVIRNGHTVTIGSINQSSGSLTIQSTGVLDLGTTTGHNFGAIEDEKITGNGTIRISSSLATAQFPNGDFGDFLGKNEGTVEYYTTGAVDFTIPVNNESGIIIPRYFNLIVNPNVSRTITMPNKNHNILGNFRMIGAGTLRLNSTSSTTLVVNANLSVENGIMEFNNNNAHTLVVYGDLNVTSGATFRVRDENTAVDNRLELYGSINNSGIFNLGINLGNTRRIDAFFKGTSVQSVTGIGGTTNFYRIYVDKGNDQTSILNISSAVFTIRHTLNPAPLYIQNGTIRFSGPTATLSEQAINIPTTGCLSINGSTVTVANTTTNDVSLLLSGKLEILSGIMNIGNQGNNVRNSIEYAAAGGPEIVISGGTLNVNGQIRRSTDISTGALIYRQSGGTVNIGGKNHNDVSRTRALLEVLNPGSIFELSENGTINLINGSATTFGDIYLDAEQQNVTGGTISVGTSATLAATVSFNLYFSNPIWNLTVDGTTRAKTAVLRTFPVTIGNNLTINGGANLSTLNTSGLNVDIGGMLTVNSNAANPFQTTGEQVTRFFGGTNGGITQNGTGTLTFQHLTIDKNARGNLVTKSGTGTVSVAKDLTINEGTLNTTTDINLSRNVYNYAASSSSGGKLNFVSALQQHIYGDDEVEFGTININNASGVVSSISFSITNNLEFTNGYLDIGDRNLVLKTDATVINPSSTRFVRTNGALSDAGITKHYSTSGGSFDFPTGIAGKFTPVNMNVTNAGGVAGTITIKPINARHPATQPPLNDELQYYWNVTSTGFNSPTITHTYTFDPSDVRGTPGSYTAGRFYNYEWFNVGSVTSPNIIHNNVGYIDGEYTAGEPANFVTKPKYFSLNSGNWETPGSWELNFAGSGVVATVKPDGNPIFIQTGHEITVTENIAYAYSVDIETGSVLNIGNTREHNLGHVTGSGTIKIAATNEGSFIFPGGYYSEFMNNPGSTVEYTGTGTLPSSITKYQNITFSGIGTFKYIPSINLVILGNLAISQGYLDNTSYNRNITIFGNWNSNVAGGFMTGRGLVTFSGLSSTITATGGETFYNLRVNRTDGQVTLASPVSVQRYLYLTRGFFKTDGTNLLTLSWSSTSAVIGGTTNASFVDGQLRKFISAGSSFYFPVGDNNRNGRNRVFSTSSSGYWTVQYFSSAHDLLGVTDPLELVTNTEYWSIEGPASSTARVLLRWDPLSDIVLPTALGRQKLRVAQRLSDNWVSLGNIISDNGNYGTVQTNISQSTNGLQYFTLGRDQIATARITGTTGSICDDGISTLTVTVNLTGDGPWSYTYTINGGANIPVTAGSSPDQIIFDYDDLYSISGVSSYVIELTGVKDRNNNDGVVLTSSATLTLLETPNPVISGNNEVITGTQRIYSVADVPGETYTWSVSKGSISSGQGTHSVTIDWGSDPGAGSVEVEVLNSVSGCSRTDIMNVQVRKNIQVTATDQGKVYGSALSGGTGYTLFSVEGLVDGETIGSVTVSYLDGHEANDIVDLYENAIVISDATGGTFDPNKYVITYIAGDLTVAKRSLSITADSDTKTYGVVYTFDNNEYTITDGTLVSGHTLSLLLSSTGAPADAQVFGSPYAITLGSVVIRDMGSNNVTANYDISTVNGQITVVQREITITAASDSKIYGQLYTFDNDEFTITDGTVVGGHTLSLVLSSTGAPANAPVSGSPYAITFSSVVITDAVSNNVTANYDISTVNGNLTVAQRNITITANSDSKTYGVAYSFDNDEFAITSGSLASDHTISLSISSAGAPADAPVSGSPYAITMSSIVIRDVGSIDVTSNYSISSVNGQLTVAQREITITAASDSKTYGQLYTFDNDEYTITDGSLLGSHTLNLGLSSTGAPANASVFGSPYAITIGSVVISDAGSNNVTANYDISTVNGQLAVTQRAITINATSQEKIYGNVLASGTGYTLFTHDPAALPNGETISSVTVNYAGGHTADAPVGLYTNSISLSNAVGANGFNSSNYSIAYNPANLTVTFSETPVNPYTVNFSVLGGNGTISATVNGIPILSGAEVSENETVVFTATPNPTFMVDEWIVNSTVQGHLSTTHTLVLTENVNVTVAFALQPVNSFIVNFSVLGSNGTISASVGGTPILNGSAVTNGSVVLFTASPASGYMVNQWAINATPVAGHIANTLNQTVTQNINATVSFTEIPVGHHTVHFAVFGGNGAISATVDGSPIVNGAAIADGKTVIFTAAPSVGYIVNQWTVNSAVQAHLSTTHTLVLNQNVDVTVAFALQPANTYLVNFSVLGGNGAISASVDGSPILNGQAIAQGKTVVFTATPNPTFMVDEWIENSTVQGHLSTTHTLVLTENVNVTVAFALQPVNSFIVNFSVLGSNGTINASVGGTSILNGSAVTNGSVVLFTASPAAGYMVNQWTINSTPVAGHIANTLNQTVTQNINATVSFTEIPVGHHTVHFAVFGGNGAISATVDGSPIVNGAAIADGKTVIFTAAPSVGYIVNQWTVNSAVQGHLSTTHTLVLNQNVDVTVAFALQPASTYLVNFSVLGGNGAISASVDGAPILNGQAIAQGKTVVFTATPNPTYMVDEWTVNSTVQGHLSTTHTLVLTENVNVTVAFALQPVNTFIVNFSVLGGNGTISASVGGTPILNGSAVTNGSAVIFTASPAAGYMVNQWTINATPVAGHIANTLNQTVTQNINATVSFTEIPVGHHTVHFAVFGGNGAISATVDGSPIVNGAAIADGKMVIFTAAPSMGYIVNQWTVNSAVQGHLSTTHTLVLNQNVDVTVAFALQPANTYLVNFSVLGGNGTISATAGGVPIMNGQAVTNGTSIVFTALPNSNYMVNDWRVNSDIQAGQIATTYTYINLDKNINVTVSFILQPDNTHIVNFGVLSGNGSISAKIGETQIYNGAAVPDGSEVTFTSTPDAGNIIEAWRINGVIQNFYYEPTLAYTVSSPVNVTVSFKVQPENTHIVNFSVIGGNGSVSAKVNDIPIPDGAAVEENADVVFIAAPANGYMIGEWRVNNVLQENHIANTLTQKVIQDINVTVSFIEIPDGHHTVHFSTLSGSGSISATVDGTPILNGQAVLHGKTVQFTATPDPTFMVSEWTVNGSVQGHLATTHSLILNQNVDVTVSFALQPANTHIVNFAVIGGNGSISATVDGLAIMNGQAVEQGKTVVLTAAPDPTFMVDEWMVNGTLQDNQIANTFSYTVASSVSITVSFKAQPENTHIVNFAVVGTNGTISATVDGLPILNGQAIEQGKTVVFNATPNSTYMVSQWTVNSTVLGHLANTHSLTLTENVSVTVEFALQPANTHIVNFAVVGGNGIISAIVDGTPIMNGQAIEKGKTVVFTATPNPTYMVNEWTVNGSVLGHLATTHSLILNENVNVTVEFALQPADTHIINFWVESGFGTISATIMGGSPVMNGSAVANGAEVIFSALPNSDYMVNEWTLNGVVVPGHIANIYSIVVSEDINVTVSFSEIPAGHFTVNFAVSEGNGAITATVNGNPIVSGAAVAENSEVVFKATPDADYIVSEWMVNGVLQGHLTTSHTQTVNENINTTVAFALQPADSYIVNFLVVGGNGTITAKVGNTEILNGAAVPHDAEVTFIASPNTGFMVNEWTLNGTPVPSHIANTFTQNVTENIGVTVSFTVIPAGHHTVNFDVIGGNGVISASVDGSPILNGSAVEDGKTVVFTATPDLTYMVSEWNLNGSVLGHLSTIHSITLTENVIVTVEFALQPANTHIVNFDVVGGNGTISASVDGTPILNGQAVDHGKEVLFTATPNLTYMVSEWTVNGTVLGHLSTAHSLILNENVDVTVAFALQLANTHIVNFDVVGGNGTISASVNGTPILNGQAVEQGETIVFTSAPNEGYIVKEWHVNGLLQEGQSSNSFSVIVNESIFVTVAFVLIDDENAIPVANDDRIGTSFNTPVTIDVLANDTGLEDEPIQVTILTDPDPLKGTVEVNTDNTVYFIPAVNYIGEVVFGYLVTDANGDQDDAIVTVTVKEGINHIPIANDDRRGASFNTSVIIDVLENDLGLEDTPIVVTISLYPDLLQGTALVNDDNTVTFTPATDFIGEATFMYTVTDADGDNDSALVTVTVKEGENFVPIAFDDEVTTHMELPVNIYVLENDTDIQDTPLTISVVSQENTAHGVALVVNGSHIRFTPAVGFIGTSSFVYKVTDVDGDFDIATVSVNVIPKLIAVPDNVEVNRNESVNINVLANDQGLDDIEPVVSIIYHPTQGIAMLNSDNSITYTPDLNYFGTDILTYRVCSEFGQCSEAVVSINVKIDKFRIPEGFSPDGDGINDKFEIIGIEAYNQVRIKIYNRWGNLIYVSEKYQNNWDGRSNTSMSVGSTLPTGTYYYTIEIVDTKEKFSGNVFLKR